MATQSSELLLLGTESDARLVGLARVGHERAFTAIVDRYGTELQAYARRLTSDGGAEDVVQQALLSAFTALQSGAEVRHLRGWLYQIVRNAAFSARRPVDRPLEEAAVCGEPLEEAVQRRATVRAAFTEMSVLPRRQREALVGTALLGFARADVAETMGLSEGAVRQLVHRARMRLRTAVGGLVPYPLVRFFTAMRSGAESAPDVSMAAGAASASGAGLKLGALIASGVLATGVATISGSHRPHRATSAAARTGHTVTHGQSNAMAAAVPVRSLTAATTIMLTRTSSGRVAGSGSPAIDNRHGSSDRGRRHGRRRPLASDPRGGGHRGPGGHAGGRGDSNAGSGGDRSGGSDSSGGSGPSSGSSDSGSQGPGSTGSDGGNHGGGTTERSGSAGTSGSGDGGSGSSGSGSGSSGGGSGSSSGSGGPVSTDVSGSGGGGTGSDGGGSGSGGGATVSDGGGSGSGGGGGSGAASSGSGSGSSSSGGDGGGVAAAAPGGSDPGTPAGS